MRLRPSLVPFAACALVLVLTACGDVKDVETGAAKYGGPVDAGAPLESGPPNAAPPMGDASSPPPPVVTVDASAPPDAAAACTMSFPSVADFGKKGPFPTTKEDGSTIATLRTADCTVYRPTTLGGTGDGRHPVVVWGNGTGAPTVIVYEWLLAHWASHGFIVAAANTPNAGTGAEMLRCLDWVQAQDTTSGSPYAGHVASGLVATSGHSQGGGGAIMAGRDARITLTVPFMAYTQGLGYDAGAAAEQHGPMLLMSGSADTIAPPAANQAPVFQDTSVPTFWGTLAGADHVTFALGGEAGYLAPSTAWLRLFLMCDESARAMFYGASCSMCADSKWTVQRKGM